MKEIRGILTAMATPFDESGAVDLDAARRLAAHLLETGSHGLVVAATSGELPTLTDEEEVLLLRAVREEVGDDVLIVCGAGTNDTRHSCELTKMVAEAGADASLVVAPYYNKPNRAGLRAHFETVAGAVPELPLIMYNIPSRVVINMPPDLLAELAQIETSSRSSRPTTRSWARLRGSRSSPATTTSSPACSSSAAPAASPSPPTSSVPRCARCGTPPRAATSTACARSTPSWRRSTRDLP
jgi:4-hydroxy-tetrahydrodipicolinate synthase